MFLTILMLLINYLTFKKNEFSLKCWTNWTMSEHDIVNYTEWLDEKIIKPYYGYLSILLS